VRRFDETRPPAIQLFYVERETLIYGLLDRRDGLIRYVGQTRIGLRERLTGHRVGSTPVSRWVRSIGRENAAMVVLRRNPEDVNAAEREVIAGLRLIGQPILNVMDGGGNYERRTDDDGEDLLSFLKRVEAEAREALRQKARGDLGSADHRIRLRAAKALLREQRKAA
jgi:hypothetical protein